MSNEQERAAFEAVFPTPPNCEWIGNGYSATDYNAWRAHEHISRWQGWQAASAGRAELLEALRDMRNRFHAACIANGSDAWAADAACAKADAAIRKATESQPKEQ